jgi:hypothetical protein
LSNSSVEISGPSSSSTASAVGAPGVEQRELAGGLLLLARLGGVDHRLVGRQQPAPGVPERGEGAGEDEVLQRALVQHAAVDLVAEVAEVLEPPLLGAGADDLLDDPLPHAAHGGEAEQDLVAARGEVGLGLVDVRRQDVDAHAPALVQVQRLVVLVVLHAGQQRRHVLDRVVGLEPGGLVADHPVGDGVGLVEAVLGELLDQAPRGW